MRHIKSNSFHTETFFSVITKVSLQSADIGWPAGNGKKLSCSQAQIGQATGLAVA